MAWLTDEHGDEFVRLQFTVADEDKHGHAVFRQVECLIPAKFQVIG
jgi:hypothetical protein